MDQEPLSSEKQIVGNGENKLVTGILSFFHNDYFSGLT